MKAAARILYIISGIFGIIGAVGLIIAGAIFMASLGNAEMMQEIYNTSGMSGTYTFEVFQQMMSAVGPFFFVMAVFQAVIAVLAFVGASKSKPEAQGHGIHIANLVFAILGVNVLTLIASIFGLVDKE